MMTTTIEQSKRLIKAGMDDNTADMCWFRVERWNREKKEVENTYCLTYGQSPYETPAWSLSALWREVSKVAKFAFQETDSPEEIIESLVKLYEDNHDTETS